MDYGKLPFTGATVTLGGVVVDQLWLGLVAFGLVGLGALMVRWGWRPGKGINEL